MDVGSGGQDWIFKHGTDIVDRGLIVLFFGIFFAIFVLFSVGFPPLWKRLNNAIFRSFFAHTISISQ